MTCTILTGCYASHTLSLKGRITQLVFVQCAGMMSGLTSQVDMPWLVQIAGEGCVHTLQSRVSESDVSGMYTLHRTFRAAFWTNGGMLVLPLPAPMIPNVLGVVLSMLCIWLLIVCLVFGL
jgi:hypothetical protein